ncbi:PQQ-dependent dehydrogenase, methanol/ethanol family [Novosphingobium sp. KN65.2]|uniref:PQQ-dependent dehydrogenase, methanol/ethanol family n=1 Tax=Novosphingobium sp. KN65.2 TaxID=1478134 RepID=UPI0005DBF84A|nr:PQQ-dependent dehydrogenase, methanol/ethanol family [Novosphingobium sp. KN65.2]CDO35202.1 Quinohaemoprotein ethanol dehydrogenase type-1 [Novosphingobium sp. KN65.2]
MKHIPPHAAPRLMLVTVAALALTSCSGGDNQARIGTHTDRQWLAQLDDGSDGKDWPAFGRTYGEQHYSPLNQINDGNVDRLGLAWSVDLPPGNPATGPIEVGGTVYLASGYSVVRAIDVETGTVKWTYDPHAPEMAGIKLRQGWGSRGIAYWNHKVIIATQDGRLIAIDEKTGKPIWTAETLSKDDPLFISGPPRVFDGKVIIGNGGSDESPVRGFVTAWDADTGKFLWKFYTVPGNPADGFEDDAMKMAAKTWSGDWWNYGGGGSVWNAITYDRANDQILIGTGNGAPWNHKIRSMGKGDNLFVCSIVALDAKTGKYKWHYQINPGESWDFNAAMDMELADLEIDGKPRQVVMTAPKNGFFYVIDRKNGKLISAEPFVDVTWASKIDLKTGRPVEAPNVRYEDGPVTFRPTPLGAHSWMPMAFSPKTGLTYIPAIDLQVTYDDTGITRETFKWAGGMGLSPGVGYSIGDGGKDVTGWLIAWDPVAQKARWKIPMEVHLNGGVMATGGNLVFQGRPDGGFSAYNAESGKRLWNFDAKAGVVAPPITYSVKGKQYVTVVAGIGTSAGLFGPMFAKYGIDYRTQQRRVLTFALGAKGTLPAKTPYKAVAFDDPGYKPDAALAQKGERIFNVRCAVCHGTAAIGGGTAPDLRTSPIPPDAEAFASVVKAGALVPNGMPQFGELSRTDLDGLRQYIRSRADLLREGDKEDVAGSVMKPGD